MRRNGLVARLERLERDTAQPCPACEGRRIVLLDDEDRYPAWYEPGYGCRGCGQDGFKAYRRSEWDAL